MAKRVPTKIGDVLILGTNKSYTAYTVGCVSEDGQTEFPSRAAVTYMPERAAAEAQARTLVHPGRRIFLLDLDTGDWVEIPAK